MNAQEIEATKAATARKVQQALRLLTEAGIEYEETGDALAVRYPGVSVDFYPATGRWKAITGKHGKWYRGGAGRFVTWLAVRRKAAAQTEFVARPSVAVDGGAA